MPNYDYECKTCGYTFEVFQNMSDPLIDKCPKCENGVRRLIGGGLGIIFKGSGFYSTDNKKSASTSSTIKSRDGGASDKEGSNGNKKGSNGAEAVKSGENNNGSKSTSGKEAISTKS